jgi:hypothetical protein
MEGDPYDTHGMAADSANGRGVVRRRLSVGAPVLRIVLDFIFHES